MVTDHATARERLVEGLRSRGVVDDEAVLEAIGQVPRHRFVPESRRDGAYTDRPLPIGDGQTISAPHMVAIIAEHLGLEPGDRVLEIGTGCGYHAAVTAALVGSEHVFSVEVSEELAERARKTLAGCGYGDVSVQVGDGRDGWPAHAPYDAAYLTCAAPEMPPAVLKQVGRGGVVVGPIGEGHQELVRIEKRVDGSADRTTHGAVRFVTIRE